MNKILVIDDNADNLLSLKALIADLFSGFTTFTADSGMAGIELAKIHPPDVILLDILMPGLDGFEVCKMLKGDENLCDIPVVFVTALRENKENKMRALEAGADGFLTKPIDEEELVAHIKAMLKIKEASDFRKMEKQRLEEMVADRTKELQDELRQKLELNKRLKESEERFRGLFEKAPLGYQALDIDGRFIEVNETWLETLGYHREEVTGKWFGDFLDPEYKEAFRERFPVFKALGKIHSEFYMVHKDGRRRYIAFDGRIGYNPDGSFRQTHCILKDETERIKVTEELRTSEERFRIAQEMSPDGFTILHPLRNETGEVIDFTLIYENQAIARINGTNPEEVKGRRLLELFPTHKGTLIFETYLDVANRSKTQILEEVYIGEIVAVPTWLRVVIVPMGDDVAVLAQNITERKHSEEKIKSQLEELQRWHQITLDREDRVIELKREVNHLLTLFGQPSKYQRFTHQYSGSISGSHVPEREGRT